VFALHSVFVTRYRRVFTDEHLTARQPIHTAACADFGATLVEFNGEDDDVHLASRRVPPTVAVSKLVKSPNGVSTRRLRQRFRLLTHRDHLWSLSYFTASCGGAPLAVIHRYIEQQRRPD
jgi:putative transposase